MNKHIFLLGLMALAALAAAKGQTPFRVTHIALSDSTKGVIIRIAADYPREGDEPLLTNARRAILARLGYPQAQPAADPSRALTPVADTYKKELRAAFEEFQQALEETSAPGDTLQQDYHFTFESSATIHYQSAKVLTYRYQAYTFAGGAHGMQTELYYTLDRNTGKELLWDDLFETGAKREALAGLVRKALVEQFYKPLGTAPAFDEAPDMFSFALPQLQPAFVKEGIIFKYAPYEIDSYAAGMPECTLSYAAAAPYLTEKAKSLIP